MSNTDTLPILLVGGDTLRSEHSLQTKHVLAVAHVALRVVLRRLGVVAPFGEVCLPVRMENDTHVTFTTSYRLVADNHCELELVVV